VHPVLVGVDAVHPLHPLHPLHPVLVSPHYIQFCPKKITELHSAEVYTEYFGTVITNATLRRLEAGSTGVTNTGYSGYGYSISTPTEIVYSVFTETESGYSESTNV
jgi:hypothetical protein